MHKKQLETDKNDLEKELTVEQGRVKEAMSEALRLKDLLELAQRKLQSSEELHEKREKGEREELNLRCLNYEREIVEEVIDYRTYC